MEVSVIIPAYNCEATISLLLNALASQIADIKYEVIVVDNESQDSTVMKIKEIQQTYSVPLILSTQPRGVTISKVRNHGASLSHGQILAFIDSDCVPPENWLQSGFLEIKRYLDLILLAGGYKPPANGTWVERAWHSTRSGHKAGSIFVHGGNFFISKLLFTEVGGFREEIETSEDYDLGRRVSQRYKVIPATDLLVTHYGEANTLRKKFLKERWYSKNVLDTVANNFLYKPFWLALCFLIVSIALIVALMLWKTTYVAVLSLALVLLSSFLALFFCYRSNCFTFLLPLVPISFAYLLGRSLGILDAFWGLVCSSFKRK